jgi:hypothetical protein
MASNTELSLSNTFTSWNIFIQYVAVMNEYFNHFTHSAKFKKNDNDNIYLLLNGQATLTHVFTAFICNTMNPVVAVENMQKSIYYYTQFIDQIEENKLYDLNISSVSASVFVYNKTIGDLGEGTGEALAVQQTLFLSNCMKLIEIYRKLIEAFIKNSSINELVLKTTSISKELGKDIHNEIELKQVLANVSIFLKSEENRLNLYEFISVYIKYYKRTNLSMEKLCIKKMMPEYSHNVSNYKKYIKWLTTL